MHLSGPPGVNPLSKSVQFVELVDGSNPRQFEAGIVGSFLDQARNLADLHHACRLVRRYQVSAAGAPRGGKLFDSKIAKRPTNGAKMRCSNRGLHVYNLATPIQPFDRFLEGMF